MVGGDLIGGGGGLVGGGGGDLVNFGGLVRGAGAGGVSKAISSAFLNLKYHFNPLSSAKAFSSGTFMFSIIYIYIYIYINS